MKRRLHPAVIAAAAVGLALLYLPMLAVAVFSVNASRYGLVWKGFTLDWYAKLFHNTFVLEAARNTLVLAVVSTLVATVLGTLLALAVNRYPWAQRVRTFMDFTIYVPVVTPDIVFAAAMLLAFGVLRMWWALFDPGLVPMVIAHVTFQIAFVALVVSSRLATIGRDIEEAARDLYADGWMIMKRVTLPLLAPGIAAGAMLAFTLSLDDFVISFFTAGPDSVTLPIFIYSSVRRGVTPEIHALSTIIFAVTVALVLGLQVLERNAKET